MPEYSNVLYVLHIVFVEIRAAKTLENARILADVVHNVPMMIRNGTKQEQIILEMMRKAKRQGSESYFSKLFEMAKAR